MAARSLKPLGFVDTTLRDAHQSLWATRMTTAMMLPIAPVMDEAGFTAIDLMGAVQFDVCVRYLRENPWERIRLLRRAVPRTPLNALVRSRSLVSFDLMPDEVVELWVRRLAANGIRRLTVFDGLLALDNLAPAIHTARAEGLTLVGALVFSLSPVHTDDLYAGKARELVAMGVDTVMIKDSGGLLTPDRVQTLVPALRAAIGTVPLELHSHCVTGIAPRVYAEGLRLGVDLVHTAISPLAHGPSQPPTESTLRYAALLGRPTTVDPARLPAIAAHFERVAHEARKPLGRIAEYDPFHYEHQVPGGMITNLEAQLAQLGLSHRREEVLEEIARVRQELGYLIMVTPFSQLVGTQAMLNVVTGDRYATVPNEVVKYVYGHYGPPVAPIDAEVMDRIARAPVARTLASPAPPPPVLTALRERYGRAISDEELLLRVMFPEEHVAAMLAAAPTEIEAPSVRTPLVELIRALGRRRDVSFVRITGPAG